MKITKITKIPRVSPPTRPLTPCSHSHGDLQWESKRERLDAEWTPLLDTKGRRVHGYAVITETPTEMLGRVLNEGSCRWTISKLPFEVEIIATRNDHRFGAMPRSTWHATRELALEHARRALVQQGKRYASKFGGAK